ncbi:hemin uptake protein HemP [Dongia sp.]|uniref:hemin uptake protein HemP n=1 Tax=Dongia sp. TaxID=1977262 RepID=UPI0035AF1A16
MNRPAQVNAAQIRTVDRPIVEYRSLGASPSPMNLARQAHQPQIQQGQQNGLVHVAGRAQAPVATVPLQAILKGAREAIIDFNGAAYRLRITRNHRLILTK